MARKPNLTSPVAVLRTVLGLTAGDFAKLVGAGKSTIQHIETGDRPLKADLADAIHLATGFPRDWLDRERVTLKEAQSWRNGREEFTDFEPRTVLEAQTAGGPRWGGTALFPSAFPRLEAIFYLVGLKRTNPALVLLAIARLEQDLASRFGLSAKEVDALAKEIEANKGSERPLGGPGHVKLVRAFIDRNPHLKGAAISPRPESRSRARGGCRAR